jgi:hypothetical protein
MAIVSEDVSLAFVQHLKVQRFADDCPSPRLSEQRCQ